MSVIEFQQDVDRDALLVESAMHGGFPAVCAVALQLSLAGHDEFVGGPDRVIAHAAWLKAQSQEYVAAVVQKIMGGASD